jgi:uncharacterized protein YaeQ
VAIYTYGERSASIWWKNIESSLARFYNLTIYYLSTEDTAAIANMAGRNISLQATIQEGDIWFDDENNTIMISPEVLKAANQANP